MLTILLQLVIAAIICGVILYLIGLIPGVAPFAQAIRVVIIAFFVIWLIYLIYSMVVAGHPPGLLG